MILYQWIILYHSDGYPVLMLQFFVNAVFVKEVHSGSGSGQPLKVRSWT